MPALDAPMEEPEVTTDVELDTTMDVPDAEDVLESEDDQPLPQEEEGSFSEAAEAQLLGEAGIEPFPDGLELTAILNEDFTRGRLEGENVFSLSKDTVEPSAEINDSEAVDASNTHTELATTQLSDLNDREESLVRESSDADSQVTFLVHDLVRPQESSGTGEENDIQPATLPAAYDNTTDLVFHDLGSTVTASSSKHIADHALADSADLVEDESFAESESSGVDGADERSAASGEGVKYLEIPESAIAISLNDATVNLGALLSRHQNLAVMLTDDTIRLKEMTQLEQDEDEIMDAEVEAPQAGTQIDGDDGNSSPDELSMEYDQTETMTFGAPDASTHLEDDKAKLSSFLQRVAANRNVKSTIVHKRESLQNRRDSDVIRKALASPRQVLEDKDTNLSPQRSLGPAEATLNLDQFLASPLTRPVLRAKASPARVTSVDDGKPDDLAPSEEGSPRRRSSRARTTKLPQLSSGIATITPNKIPVRTDGGGQINLNKTDVQVLAELVRRNTKKNKGIAINAPLRLIKLKLESLTTIVDGDPATVETLTKEGVKTVQWNEKLVEFATSPATADLEAAADTQEEKIVVPPKKAGTPRSLRKLKGLGSSNGTPAKKVLQSTLMPEEVEEAKAASAKMEAAKPKPAPVKLDAAETQDEPKKEKKSKILPPKKLNLNPSVTSISGLPVLAGKENAVGLLSPAKKLSKIPAPSSILTPADFSSGIRPPMKRVRSGGKRT